MIVRVPTLAAWSWLTGRIDDMQLFISNTEAFAGSLYMLSVPCKRTLFCELHWHLRNFMPELVVFRAHTPEVFRLADKFATVQGLDETLEQKRREIPVEFTASIRYAVEIEQSPKFKKWLERVRVLNVNRLLIKQQGK